MISMDRTNSVARTQLVVALNTLGERLGKKCPSFYDAWQEITENRPVRWIVAYSANPYLANVLSEHRVSFAQHQPMVGIVSGSPQTVGGRAVELDIDKDEILFGQDHILWQERSHLVVLVTHDIGVGVIYL